MRPLSRNGTTRPARLRPAPDRLTTPLPGHFGLVVDPATTSRQSGEVVMGGSPLRLLRLTPRAVALVGQWRAGKPVGERRGGQLLARRLVAAGTHQPRPRGAGGGPGDVTVVIPVQNRPEQLHRLLTSLGGLACVVVDDASSDPGRTRQIAESAGADCICLPHNLGPSAARNAGLRAATTPLVAFVDSDCTPSEGWLEPLLGHFDDPLVAAVAPRITPSQGGPRTRIARYEATRSSLDRGDTAGLVRPMSRIPYVPSAALIVRREVAADPFFDPSLRGGEDVDLVWRLVEAGWDIRYVPSSQVTHDGPVTARAFFARRAFYGSTAGPLARRHPSLLAPVHTSAWTAAVWALALRRRPALSAATLVVSVLVLAHRLRGLVREPVRVAGSLAAGGSAKAALPALAGLTRAWSPAAVVALLFRRTRRAGALALLVPAVHDWSAAPGDLDPVRYVALHVADDLAYGAGLWRGCMAARTIGPLVPRIAFRSRQWSVSALRDQLRPDRVAVP